VTRNSVRLNKISLRIFSVSIASIDSLSLLSVLLWEFSEVNAVLMSGCSSRGMLLRKCLAAPVGMIVWAFNIGRPR